ncbi:MAG: protein kinase, partial [Bacteroidota bacterium]
MGNFKKVEYWYNKALEVADESRIQYLEKQLSAQPDLLHEVKTLVLSAYHEQSLLTQLREELKKDITQDTQDEFPQVAKYELTEEIGVGGMAVVYRAARTDGVFDHEVALKVLKRGMDTDDIVKRFRQERNVLARLRHPNIGQIYDGGVTTDGRPYFVMELIKGTSLIEYAEDNDLSVLKRLDLFIKVCQAVEFAHQNLIIHRDIKPSNILVDKNEQVKLMDFGIAKLVSPDNKWDFTIAEQKLLTPKFASPEQFNNEPVDIRSDVFQLGKVLELLLNGTKSNVDLWAISQYATREEKEDRYANVGELGEDINNYLTHKPISAKKSSGSYVLRKFISRHKTAVSLSSLLFVIIVLFTGLYIQQIGKERKQTENALIKAQNESQRAITALKKADEAAHKAQEASLKADSARKLAESRSESLVRANNLVRLEKERSEDEAAKSKAILGFVNSLFSEAHPNTSLGDTLTIFELMEKGETALSKTNYRLDIKTEILRNTAKIYQAWEDPKAHLIYKEIMEYDENLYGKSSNQYFSSFFEMIETSPARGEKKVILYNQLLEELQSNGENSTETKILVLQRLAIKYYWMNNYHKYDSLFTEARDLLASLNGSCDDFSIYQAFAKYWAWKRNEKAEYFYDKTYELIKKH